MAVVWGIHNDQSSLDLVSEGFVSIGWQQLGDLRTVPHDRESLKLLLTETYPTAKPGAIPVWAGIISRFIDEVDVGDYVISPSKADRTLNFGRVESDFYVETNAEVHPNRRRVTWLQTGVPRDMFSKAALNEIGSAMTLFRVKRHAAEFLDFLGGTTTAEWGRIDDGDDLVEQESNASHGAGRSARSSTVSTRCTRSTSASSSAVPAARPSATRSGT